MGQLWEIVVLLPALWLHLSLLLFQLLTAVLQSLSSPHTQAAPPVGPLPPPVATKSSFN